jgi:thymidylate synthase (FAD)
MDKFFRVEVISQTINPQQVIYTAMHQDYSEDFVYESQSKWPSEQRCGEIIVKNLLAGDRGHYGCYSADTEVLTKRGWKRWDEVSVSDELLAVNIETQESHFEHPTAIQSFDLVSGDKMYSVESAYINLQVTRDHRMVVSHRKSTGGWTDWYFKEAKEVEGRSFRYLLNCSLVEKDRFMPEMPDKVDPLIALKLAGFFFGDGVRSQNIKPQCIRFRLRLQRKIDYLYSLLLPVEEMESDRYVIRHPELAGWIHTYFSGPEGKVVPDWLLTLPKEAIEAFWDGLKNSDGTRIKENSWCYDSTAKSALDVIQSSAQINGLTANMVLNNENAENDNHKPCWRIHISDRKTYRSESNQKGRGLGITEKLIDYTGKVYCATVSTGALLVRRGNKAIVCGNCIEHPNIVFNCGYFPHSVMQQARTHRVGISFDVMSLRYTSTHILNLAKGEKDVEEVFYLRPPGYYSDRSGKKYFYSEDQRANDLLWCTEAAKRYYEDLDTYGMSEEHARGKLPFDYRQHFVVSFNCRSLMHFLDMRYKADAQLEIQQMCELIIPHFKRWTPQIYEWYKERRLKKARLAP